MVRRHVMRKLIVSNIISLDGYYEGPGKNVMVLFDYRWGHAHSTGDITAQ